MAHTHDHMNPRHLPRVQFRAVYAEQLFYRQAPGGARLHRRDSAFTWRSCAITSNNCTAGASSAGSKSSRTRNAACRDRFVCIEPGSAVDCCGHEIMVREEECVDITQLPAIKALQESDDTEPPCLQVCLRYRECPTEEIPVLYDECGCDDTQCAPNRILESYDD